MLMRVVLVRFGHAHRGKARLEQRDLIAATAVAVGAINHLDPQVRQIPLGKRRHGARDVARRRIELAAVVAPPVCLCRRLQRLRAFGEHAHRRVVTDAVAAVAVADDVVVEVGLDLPAFRSRVLGEDLAAVQALLFARQHGIDERRAELVLGQNPRRFHDRRHARAVVVGAGRIARRIHDVADARIEVAADDDHTAGVAGAALDRDHVDDFGGLRNARAADHLRRRLDLETVAAVPREACKTRSHPAPCGADSARLGPRVRQSVAGAEAHERRDRRIQRGRVDAVGDVAQQPRPIGRMDRRAEQEHA